MSKEAMKLAASVLKGSQEYKRGHTTFVEAVEELEAALAEQPAPAQEPVAWVTVEKGVCVSTRSANFRHTPDGQHQLYVGPLQNDVVAAITTLKDLGYVYNESKTFIDGDQWVAPQPAPMLQPNRVISYAAAMKLRELGYEWMNDEWKHLAEQPAPVQQEPFGYFKAEPFGWTDCAETDEGAIALYTTPQAQPSREWVGLTEEEKTELRRKHYPLPLLLMDATEAKLKEKNHD